MTFYTTNVLGLLLLFVPHLCDANVQECPLQITIMQQHRGSTTEPPIKWSDVQMAPYESTANTLLLHQWHQNLPPYWTQCKEYCLHQVVPRTGWERERGFHSTYWHPLPHVPGCAHTGISIVLFIYIFMVFTSQKIWLLSVSAASRNSLLCFRVSLCLSNSTRYLGLN